ncbi:MAG: hypothetical protein ACK5L8_10720 [Marinicella pacifica]
MKPSRTHIFLCLAVFASTALAEKGSSFLDHLSGIQAVDFAVSLQQADELELYISDSAAEISAIFYPTPYGYIRSEYIHTPYLAKSARAPPSV